MLITGAKPASVPGWPPIEADSVQLAGRTGARTPVRGRGYLIQRAAGRDWRVSLGSFWQVHPGAADALAGAVLAALHPQPGETALDLYCGAGLFAGVLAQAVGPDGGVIAIEHDGAAVRDARHNLRDWPWARVHRGDVAAVLSPDWRRRGVDRSPGPAADRRGEAGHRRAVRPEAGTGCAGWPTFPVTRQPWPGTCGC